MLYHIVSEGMRCVELHGLDFESPPINFTTGCAAWDESLNLTKYPFHL